MAAIKNGEARSEMCTHPVSVSVYSYPGDWVCAIPCVCAALYRDGTPSRSPASSSPTKVKTFPPDHVAQEVGSDCFTKAKAQDYRGHFSTTILGKTCQKWSEQDPHMHTFNPGRCRSKQLANVEGSVGVLYCRNPDGRDVRKFAWCYPPTLCMIRDAMGGWGLMVLHDGQRLGRGPRRWDYCTIGLAAPSCPDTG
eukprot:gene57350-biopygen88693